MRDDRLRSTSPPLLWSGALIAAVLLSLAAAPAPENLCGAALAALMIGIAAIDARRFIIPNELSAAAFLLGLLRAGFVGYDAGLHNVAWSIVGAAAASLPLLALMLAWRRWRGHDGLGLGDVKLAAVAGAWLEGTTLFVAIEAAALAAIAAYLIVAVARGKRFAPRAFLPFGAFLAPAIWLGWLAEQWLRGGGLF